MSHRMYQEVLPKHATKKQVREALSGDINKLMDSILSIKDITDDVDTTLSGQIKFLTNDIQSKFMIMMKLLE